MSEKPEEIVYDIITSIPRCDGAADIKDIELAAAEIVVTLGQMATKSRQSYVEQVLENYISLETHRAALNVVAKVASEAEKRAIDLTDELEQCKLSDDSKTQLEIAHEVMRQEMVTLRALAENGDKAIAQSLQMLDNRDNLIKTQQDMIECLKEHRDKLTDELEQCKIELQMSQDRIRDLENELESTNWDRPIH